MIEIDIIKDYLFSKDEIKLISLISNPNFVDIDKDKNITKIDNEYHEDRFLNSTSENTLKNVLFQARNNTKSNKLLCLIQEGNRKLVEI